jgi:predicted Fe-Mo cluster-binding NifX family protein
LHCGDYFLGDRQIYSMDRKRIAVGTSDGVSVCEHLARSSAFVVMETEEGRCVGRSVRPRFRDGCGNHASFIELLAGCDAVICGGIGQGAWDALVAHGVEPVVAAERHSVEAAAAMYLAGELQISNEKVCLCH